MCINSLTVKNCAVMLAEHRNSVYVVNSAAIGKRPRNDYSDVKGKTDAFT